MGCPCLDAKIDDEAVTNQIRYALPRSDVVIRSQQRQGPLPWESAVPRPGMWLQHTHATRGPRWTVFFQESSG